ncbi:MAG: alpha/beta hydrolase, partial [Spirochaetia bacterium]
MHTSGEKVIELEAGWCYLRYAEAGRNNPSLLFIHGLGDSSLAFDEALADESLRDFNLYAPDLFGCGRSTCAGDNDYRLEKLGRHLRELMKQLEVESYYLVGHSMGGDIATLMAQADVRNTIRAVVNIEGNLTQDDLFISRTAAQMSAAGR